MSICPNCRSPVTPADDICEQCGAVLVSTAIVQPDNPISAALRAAPPGSSPAWSLTACPNCQRPVTSHDEICEHCGMVLASAARSASSASATLPPAETPAEQKAPESANRLKTGQLLNNRYAIVKSVGSGGMGAVYLAEDQVLKRQVVLKALLSENDKELIAQSIKEREFLATIKHANIVSIYDFLTIGAQGFIVMEHINGKTLEQIMEEQGRPFEAAEAIRYMLGILPAFTYLAKLGLVYCDFKPQNVMLEVLKDGTQVLKLVDLGTVIKYGPKPDAVYGTPGFHAREAIKNPSPETDLYSVCRALAYLVTQMDLGKPLFGMPPAEHYRAFRDHPALYRLLVKGTHADPARRFHRAEDLSDQLAGVLRQIIGGAPGVPVSSRLFLSGPLATTGKLGQRGEALLDESDLAIGLLHTGDQALRMGNHASARDFYAQATRANPKSVDAHLRQAEVFIEQGEYTHALNQIGHAQRLAPTNWKLLWYLGRLMEAQGHFSEALEQYHDLLNELPGELPPQQALARVYARQGNHQVAITLYSGVLKADSGHTEAIFGLTDSLVKLERWDEAVHVLSNVSEATARYVDAQLLLCKLYVTHMTPLTVPHAEQAAQVIAALAGHTEDPRFYLTRGDVYRALWQLAQQGKLPSKTKVPGLPDANWRTLGSAAEASYVEYLHRETHPANRETVVRCKFEVAPWRLW
ncbi:MAG TPA: tetratricopeptide repeat protein [Ktedonobacterales bacterium]